MNEATTAKIGKGIAFSPDLLERIDEEARVYRRSRSWVIEERLRDSFGMRPDLQTSQGKPKMPQPREVLVED